MIITVSACSGPESSSPLALTATPTEGPATEPTPTETSGSTEIPDVTPTQTPTEETAGEPTPSVTPTEASTPTPTNEPTPTVIQIALSEALPTAGDLPGDGFALANQGPRSDLDLANAYSDPSEHLDRLNEWGFEEHYFREFSRDPSGDSDPLPTYVLTTGNRYGSPEQAEDALTWLRRLNQSQGHDFADDPEFGDNAIASSVATAEGTPTAIVFVRIDRQIFAVFASGGDPLPFVLEVGELIAERAGWAPSDSDDDSDSENQDGEEDEN